LRMIYDTIKKLITLLKEEEVDEIEVRRLWTTVRVARRRGDISAQRQSSVSITDGAAPSAEEHGAREPDANYDSMLEKIVSPMVGTFFRASNPEAEPFVYEGKRVEQGEILCIIEAMKLMNEIEADKSGVIRKILVRDSEPVEYGQALFLVESA
jgi:acetyl-CoA carboxylase biotin carboxyl carrier protein